MPVTNVKAIWNAGKLQYVDTVTGTVIMEISVDGVDPRARIKETVSANKPLDAQDTGKIIEVDTDAVVLTLPSTVAGITYHIRNIAADGAAKVSISPAAIDLIAGPDIAGVDDKDLISTKATAKRGDYVVLVGNGAAGWHVVDISGIWAAEA